MIRQNMQRPRDNEMQRLGFPDTLRRAFETLYQIGRAASSIVSIGREYMHASLVQHAFGPVFGLAPKCSGQGTRCNLHPDATISELPYHRILLANPPQSFGMR